MSSRNGKEAYGIYTGKEAYGMYNVLGISHRDVRTNRFG
jgi:hypothetical protein